MVKLTEFEEKEFKVYEEKIKKVFPGTDMLYLTLEYFQVIKALDEFEETHTILNYYGEYDMKIPDDDEIINSIQELKSVLVEYMERTVFNELEED